MGPARLSPYRPAGLHAWMVCMQVAARMKQYEDELARKRMMADHELQRQRNAENIKMQVGRWRCVCGAAGRKCAHVRADGSAVVGGGGGQGQGQSRCPALSPLRVAAQAYAHMHARTVRASGHALLLGQSRGALTSFLPVASGRQP